MIRDTWVFAVSGRQVQPRGDLVVGESLRDKAQHLDARARSVPPSAAGSTASFIPGGRPLEQAPGDARARAARRPPRPPARRG